MRTTVAVDHELMAEAVRLSGIKTKRGVIEQALKLLVQIKGKRQSVSSGIT